MSYRNIDGLLFISVRTLVYLVIIIINGQWLASHMVMTEIKVQLLSLIEGSSLSDEYFPKLLISILYTSFS